jgi:peptidyl-prolyl cis-trans isomerase SurA
MRPSRTLALLTALLLACGASPAAAQPLQRIAAVVNDEVISLFDLENRTRLVIATSGLLDNGETRGRLQGQIMRSLIDERLQMQEANRLNVSVSESDVEGAIQRIEQANRMPRGGLVAALREASIDRSAIETQIKAAIGWQKVANRRLRPTLQVGEDEIDEVLERITASKGAVEYQLAEIFLSVETPEQEDEVRQNAENLVEQMRRGTAFAAIAQQFSQSASAQSGGDIGWVERSQIEDEIVSILDQMPVGRSTLPIRNASGFYLYLLRDRRVLAAPSPDDATVTLAQLVIAIDADATAAEIAAQKDLAQTVQESVAGCEDLQRAAQELGAPPVDPTPDLRVGDLNPAIRPVMANLKVGDAAAPMQTDAGFAIVMVCARQEAKSNLPGRNDIAENLTRQRLDLMSRRYLRDLRRAAFIDVRV